MKSKGKSLVALQGSGGSAQSIGGGASSLEMTGKNLIAKESKNIEVSKEVV